MIRRLPSYLLIASAVALLPVADADAGSRRWSRHGPERSHFGGHHGGYGYGYSGYRHHGYSGHRHHRYSGYRHHGYSHGHGGLSFGVGVALGAAVHSIYAPRGYYTVYSAAPVGYTSLPSRVTGSVETDVRPSSAAVYVDGDPVGIADDYNGWPSRLYLEPGTHEILFREPGYEPLRVTVEVLPRHTVRIDERLERAPTGTSYYDAPAPEDPGYTSQPTFDRMEPSGARASGRSTLQLEVEPSDARVYIDGEARSTAAGARYLVELVPGTHKIEVVKPGYDVFEGEVVVRDGQRQELTVRLSR